MKSSPAILIINVHSSLNSGDSALLLMNIQQLRDSFTDAKFTVSANYPEEEFFLSLPDTTTVPSVFHLVGAHRNDSVGIQILRLLWGLFLSLICRPLPESWMIWLPNHSWFKLIRTYKSASFVVAVSGNQFLSMGKFGWPFPLTSYSVAMAHLYGKSFYVMPQSIGPLKRWWEVLTLRFLYCRARLIFIRDSVSLRLSLEIGLPREKVFFAPDPAFCLEPAGRDQGIAILSEYGYRQDQPSVGVTVIDHIAKTLDKKAVCQYRRDLAYGLARFIQQYGGQIYIFNQVIGPTSREDDRIASRELVNELRDYSSKVVIVDKKLSAAQLKACYGCMDLFIASRLHSGIFSIGMGVPTLFIGYFSKTRGLLESLDMVEWLLEIGNTSGDRIWEKIDMIWKQRQKVAKQADYFLKSIGDCVPNVGKKIFEDYFQGE